jgi:peroxiredoxin
MADGDLHAASSPQPKVGADGASGIPENRVVNVGDEAPDFQLPALIAGVKKTFHLRESRGERNVVLAFYPFNWQETSARQMAEYQAQRERVLAMQAETVGIAVDSIMNMTAWEREIGPFDFPLCSDFWPHGEVAARYGVLQGSGASQRAVFVVDRRGRVVFQKAYPEDCVPPIEDFLVVLEGS